MNHLHAFIVLLTLCAALTQAIPSFIPAKSVRSGYGTAPIRHLTQRNDEDIQAARRSFEQNVAKRAQAVASKYPVNYLSNVSDYSLWEQFQDTGRLPQPIRGKTGATSIGPENPTLDRQNPDAYAPPSTDSGTVPQAKWPFALSHNRLQNGGWARQQNQDVLPVATELAGVNMRLEEGAYREMHWHSASEWSYILNGTFRVSTINDEGQNEVSDISAGDLWFFEAGRPHSIQSISPGGGEFLLVFDSGAFDEDATLLLSDFIAHIPREVVIKNFPGMNNSDFDRAPEDELYIFPSDPPAANDTQQVSSPQGSIPSSVTYKFSEVKPTQLNGGSIKIVDSRNFTASKDIAAAEVVIEPNAMRELHWHPTDEWNYFLQGHARITVFAGSDNARTFDFQAGDVGYITTQNGHYIENIGTTPVKYLEVFKSSKYSDFSLSNWLALTPAAVVKAHLGFSDSTINKLQQFKTHNHQLVSGSRSSSNLPPDQQKRSPIEPRMIGGKKSWS